MKEKIDKILKEQCFADQIFSEQSLEDDLGMDSLSMVELLVEIEETFQIQLEESDLNPSEFEKVLDIYKLVEKYVGGTQVVI